MLVFSLIIAALLQPWSVKALSPKFLPCQLQKPLGVSPLSGCPEGTIFVSKTDSSAQFGSIQEAILSLPEGDDGVILIGQGVYQENVNISRSAPVTLLGQVAANFANSVDEPFANATRLNLVQIFDTRNTNPGQDDAESSVLTVAPNRAAALIGAGPTGAPLQPEFGNVDFKAYNIDFQNRASLTMSLGQSLATDISYANASFYGCSFASFQDTWYTGRNASTYVVDSVFFGQTDYLFGFGTAWFQNVILANRGCGGGIVAWKGTNQTDAHGNRYGAYLSGAQIIQSPDSSTNITQKCFLGRPWNDLATTVLLNTFMENVIQPIGWTHFSDRPVFASTTFYAEFNSTGPGSSTTRRDPIEHILTADQAKQFTVENVFSERPKWVDFDYRF